MLPDSPSSDYDLYKAESDAQNRWNQYYGKPVMDQVKDEVALNAHVLVRQRSVRYDTKGSEDSVHDTSELDGSAESESLSHDYKESVTDTSDNLYESAESEPPSPLKTRRNNDKLQRNKRSSYIPPKESKEDRTKATARISKALDQVPLSVHLNPQGKRKTATLYVGNLAFNASEQDLGKSLDTVFLKIRV